MSLKSFFNSRIKKTLLFILLPFTINTFSQTRVFTIEEAIKTALMNNRDIIIAKMDIEKSEEAVDEAFGYALPSVDISANFSHFLEKPKTPFPDFEALLTNATYNILFDENVIPRDNSKFRPINTALQSFALSNSYETSVQVTQTLFNSAVFRGIGASQIYLDLSKSELDRKVASSILDTKKAFYGVLLTKRFLEITEASYNNALENLKNVKALHSQGMVSEYDALQAEVRVENIKPTVQQIKNDLKNAKNGLKIILGIDQKEDIDVEGEFVYEKENLPEEYETIQAALEDNYSINSLKYKMQVDEAFLALDRAEYWPSLYAFGNYTYAGSSDNWNFQNYSSSIIGVTFSMNLFNGNRTKNKVQQSEISLKQTGQQLSQLNDFISSQVKAKLNELIRVQTTLDAQERNVVLAEKAYKISTVRYQEGTGSQLEVENADIALKQARINRLQSIYDYIIAKSGLNELLGKVESKYFELLKLKN